MRHRAGCSDNVTEESQFYTAVAICLYVPRGTIVPAVAGAVVGRAAVVLGGVFRLRAGVGRGGDRVDASNLALSGGEYGVGCELDRL